MDWRRFDPKLDLAGFDPERALAASEPAKENLHRTVAPCEVAGKRAFLKRQKPGPKALREAENSIRLREGGIPAAEPLAVSGDGSFLLTAEIAGGRPLHDVGAADRGVQRALGRLLKDVHEAGCWHPDLHTGNVLVSTAPDGKPWLTVMDTGEARFLSVLDDSLRIRSLGMLAASLEGLGGSGLLRILKAYFAGTLPEDWKTWARQALKRRDKIWDVHWKSRTKRCTRTTGEFQKATLKISSLKPAENPVLEGSFATVHRRELSETEVLGALLNAHTLLEKWPADALKREGRLIKRDRGTSVMRIPLSEASLCIKTFHPKHALDRLRSRAKRAWIRANALWERGCATAKPLAWIEDGRDHTGYLVTEDLSAKGLELDRWVSRHWRKLPPRRRRRFLKDFGLSLARMSDRGVWPGDAKACNFFVVENGDGWTFPLVDVDSLRLRRPDILDVAQAFMQLSLSTPRTVSRRARQRLVREMLGRRMRRDGKELVQMTARLCGTERILYQSDSGDVTEPQP